MKKHVMSMTYHDKIPAVLDGRCTQTIRTGRRFAVGDEINFVGYNGKAWRKRVVVNSIDNITISYNGIGYYNANNYFSIACWGDFLTYGLASDDFINPPTGEALRDVLFGLNGAPDEPQEYQIIRWKVI